MRPRFHARFPGMLCAGLDGLGAHARLAAFRLEPVRTIDGPQHRLDLTFVDGERVGVVAGIRIDRLALAHRDRSPFVAPREGAGVTDALAAACEAVEPLLLATFAACAEPEEALYPLPGVAENLLGARREAGALGAARYARVARARGRAVTDDAYLETCFAGDLPHLRTAAGATFGGAGAALRCYVAVSDEALASSDGSYRAARAMGVTLGDEELAVDVAGYDGRPLEPYAFVHAVGLDDPEAVLELFAAARARGLRTVLTPRFDDPCAGGFWGARAHPRVLSLDDDEELIGGFLEALRTRNLVLDDGARADAGWEPRAGYREAQRTALASADAVLVASAAEAQRIRRFAGERAFAADTPLAEEIPARDAAVVPYVLAVAPLGPLHASATIARAAARAGLPVRFAGSVVDGAYAARARSYLDDRSSITPGDPGRGARVVADLSWTGADLGALASHAAHGVPVVGSNRSDVRDVFGTRGVWEADPGDEVALAAALCEAWNAAGDHAHALAAHVGPRTRADVLRACLVNAYRSALPVS